MTLYGYYVFLVISSGLTDAPTLSSSLMPFSFILRLKKSMLTIFVLFLVSCEDRYYMPNFPSVSFGWIQLCFGGMWFQGKG